MQIGIVGFVAIAGAAIMLAGLVVPADRGGQPILVELTKPFLKQMGIRFSANVPPVTPVQTTDSQLAPRFIVRFEDNPIAEDSLREFRENRTTARQKFEQWADASDHFRGFHLVSLTPSGEAVLVYEGILDQQDGDRTIRRLTRQLLDAPGVSYVDPYIFRSTLRQ